MKPLYILPLLSLAACSTITSGTSQSILIETPEVEAAACDLTDSKGGQWHVKETPGSATVRRGDGPMTVICKKPGYNSGTVQVEEGLAGATLGNVILGGGIGILVDAASGAAQKYPDSATVWMEPKEFASEEARIAWTEKHDAYLEEQKDDKQEKSDSLKPQANKRN